MYRLLRSKRLHTTSRKPTIDFDLQVKDFGPVREADISIKPLTILIGPNRSGKSQLAMLTHTLISSYNKIHEPNQRYARESFRSLYKIIKTEVGKSTSDKKDKITITASELCFLITCNTDHHLGDFAYVIAFPPTLRSLWQVLD